MALHFPEGFVWGTATAAYQIEGAVSEDGRCPSIWDTFSHTPGKIKNDDNGDIADDHYHRWRDDIALMKRLNVNAYRFSVAWPRILPNGRGAVNQAGIDFYSRLVDGLLEAGITPYVTLYHWDLPQPLQDDGGGWQRRSIVDDFVAYTDVVSRALGDRAKDWITFNEPWVIAWLGYAFGIHAPGVVSQNFAPALTATHNVYLAHGQAVPLLRQNVSGARVGITLDFSPAEPASDDLADLAATQLYDGFRQRWFIDPLLRGEYPADMLQIFGDAAPSIQPGDLKIISAPLDFLGVNYYQRAVIKASSNPLQPFEFVHPAGEYTAMDWEVYPQGLYNLLTRLQRDYALPALYITENGAAYDDLLTADGHVHDERRTAYLRGHFEAAQRAIADGVPLKGYFIWSAMDNFEWSEGYSRRFGLYYVDYATLRRTLKDSGAYFAQVAAGK